MYNECTFVELVKHNQCMVETSQSYKREETKKKEKPNLCEPVSEVNFSQIKIKDIYCTYGFKMISFFCCRCC